MLENIYTTKMSANKKQLQNRFTKIRSSSGRFSKMMSFIMAIVVAVTMLCTTVVMAALNSKEEIKEPITLYSNGEMIVLDNKPFIQDNMTYFPVRETFEKLGVFEVEGNELVWDNGTIHIKVAENTEKEPVSYTIKIGSDMMDIKNANIRGVTDESAKPLMKVKLQLSEEKPLLVRDKTYVPYTYIDYMLNRGLGIRNNTSVFDFMFTINGETPSAFVSQGFTWPCDGEMPIANRYGTRTHPITGEVLKHNGIDIVAPEGTNVRSAIYGTVTEAGYNPEKGYFIIIERDTIQTVYASLTQDMQVKKGDEVIRGQNIGKVGKTGTSTSAHLHFEVLLNGEYYNPELIG